MSVLHNDTTVLLFAFLCKLWNYWNPFHQATSHTVPAVSKSNTRGSKQTHCQHTSAADGDEMGQLKLSNTVKD
jgi:hypothetical protein